MVIIGEYLPRAVCEQIRSAYEAALLAGRIMPNGPPGHTDVPLSLIWPSTPAFVEDVANLLRWHLRFAPLTLDYCAYARLLPGHYHELHADAFKLDGTPNHTPARVATAMVYLSEAGGDFMQGVLRFPKLGVDVHARPGLLVGFPTDLQHQHEVSVIASGVRDSIAVWFK